MIRILDSLAELPGAIFAWSGVLWAGAAFAALFVLLLVLGLFRWPSQERLTFKLAGQYSVMAATLSGMVAAALFMGFAMTCLFAAFFACLSVIFTNDVRACLRVGVVCGLLTWAAIPLAVMAFARLCEIDPAEAGQVEEEARHVAAD